MSDRDADLLRLAGRLARFGGWSIDVPSAELSWSAELFSMLGVEPAAGAPPLDVAMNLFPEDERRTVQAALDRCIAEGTPIDLEGTILHRQGEQLRVRMLGEAVRDATGQIVRIHGAFYDVTEIVTAREERLVAHERLRTTLDYIPEIITFVDADWRVTFANRAAMVSTGMSEEQLRSETIWELFPETMSDARCGLYERAMTGRLSGTIREFLEKPGVWIEVTVHPIEGGIAIFVRDVTDDETMRQQIREVSTHAVDQAELLDASHEAMIMEDLGNVVTYWNRGAEHIYGWTREEAVGRDIRELLYADPADFEPAAEALLRDGSWRGELQQRTKDGRTVIIQCRWQAVLDAAGKPTRLFAVNSDVTEQRRAQQLSNRAQRMESLGTLAGGIAHDLNNVLTPLLMSVQLLKSQHPSPEQATMLAGMETGITRGADMIRQVLAFARGVEGVRNLVSLAEVVQQLESMSLQTLPKDISARTHIDDAPLVIGDSTQILQVLINLVSNARDAMPDGGELVVSVRKDEVDDLSHPESPLPSGAYALITVEDTGSGMTADVLDKIFEPFYTTKELGSGTGLGLATSMAIVRSHGGTITAYSDPGVGTRFRVYLPLAHGESVVGADASPELPLPSGSGELVLVVDDEASIRRTVCLTLESHGYRAVEAINGRDAIEVFEAHAGDVRLVFTDMMMPVMDGAAVASYFTTHHPDVPVVAASGLAARGGVSRASNSGARHFLTKPFTTEMLLRTVAAALDE